MKDKLRTVAVRRQVLTVTLVAMLLWGFVRLGAAVSAGDTLAFDTRVLLLLRNPADQAHPIGPWWLAEFGRDVTALGSVGILTAVVLAAAGFLWLHGKYRALMFLLFVTITGGLLSQWLKAAFDRPRPDLVPHGSQVFNASFPSGHSLSAAVVYLTLGMLIAHHCARPASKAYVMTLAIAITLIVGVSRVYLGVHWPTDVLAGWAAGASWALLCVTVARILATVRTN